MPQLSQPRRSLWVVRSNGVLRLGYNHICPLLTYPVEELLDRSSALLA